MGVRAAVWSSNNSSSTRRGCTGSKSVIVASDDGARRDEWGGLRKEDDGDDRRIEYDDVDDPESLSTAYRAGTVVRHQQFGTGVVASFSRNIGVVTNVSFTAKFLTDSQ